MNENTCIGCGCTELDACVVMDAREPCSWLMVDLTACRGVCNQCPEHLKRFIAGDRDIRAELPA